MNRIWTLAAVISTLCTLSAAQAAETYAAAYARAEKSGEPLLIVVGAEWCPACKTMKYSTIPAMEKQGKLNGVAVAFVNVDQESQIAGKLMRGGLVPQVIVYRKTGDGWFRRHLQGGQSTGTLASVLNEAKTIATTSQTIPAGSTPTSAAE